MGSTKYQYLAALCGNLLSIGYGAICGWPSSSTLFLMSEESPLATGKITMGEASSITAIMCVGGLVGNIGFGWVTERYGRRIPLLCAAIPQILSWLLILLATNVTHLYIARFLAGLSGGGAFVIIPQFVAEISDDKIRGTLGSFLVLSCNTGILTMFLLGNYVSYQLAPKILIGLTVFFLCSFMMFPESPQFLLKNNKDLEAEKSLRFYRGIRPDENQESELLQIELDKLRIIYSEEPQSKSNKSGLTIADFKTPEAKRALLISFVLVALNQFCGCFAMLNYTASIFEESGSDLTPNMSAIVVGAIELLGSYFSTVLVDKAGRKFLIGISALGTSLGQIGLGMYALLQILGYDMSSYGWIPIASFSFVIFIASWGVLTLPFLVMSEILPEKIRNIGTSTFMSLLWIFAFVMLKIFPMLAEALGMHGCMFLFAFISFIGALFVILCMPETKGKSFEEIMELLKK